MSERERYGTRDLTFSNWHRTDSLARFLGRAQAERLTMIDLDGVQYCDDCKRCYLLIEAARDVGQGWKPTTVLRSLAIQADIRAVLILYRPDPGGDIESFRVRTVYPELSEWESIDPAECAIWLFHFLETHACLAVAS